MNKKVLIAVLVVVLAIGASVTYVLFKKNDPTPVVETTQQKEAVVEQPEPTPTAAQPGVYVDYSAETLASTKGAKLLFFHAPWCPQCRDLEASIKASKLPDNLTIFKVDYDSNQSLRAKYGVTLQTTIVKVDDNGTKIASYVAYDEPNFQSIKQALLP